MKYLASIGLEVHVQLKTRSKMFCGCRTTFGDAPNGNVCPVCLGYPGAMPAMNETAVKQTVLTGLMLGSRINETSKFDRKSYFYPDMPKNYQISQYDLPLCVGGAVEVESGSAAKTVRIRRIHLEEDVAKSMHYSGFSGVDFNRAGIPLMEIVTEPDMESADTALAFLAALKQIILYSGVSDCNLEEGNIRCDVNCSVRPEGRAELGTKSEVKNLNTFKGVHAALEYEIHRQTEALESGGTIAQETRRWDSDAGATYSMRSKEDAHDYRYFPEPDLMPIVISPETIEQWRSELPELPRQRRERLAARYGLPPYDAKVLASDRKTADFFEEAAKGSSNYKVLSNWIMTEVMRVLSESGAEIDALKVTPAALAELAGLVDRKVLHATGAKEALNIMLAEGGSAAAIVEKRGLAQVSDSAEIEALVARVVGENAGSVDDYRRGKKAALQFLVGQAMRISGGKANPGLVMKQLEEKLR